MHDLPPPALFALLQFWDYIIHPLRKENLIEGKGDGKDARPSSLPFKEG